jgi:BMFP domain-containing protein YqiC
MFFELLTIFLLARNMNKQDELENRVNQLENKTTLRYEYDGEQVEDLA